MSWPHSRSPVNWARVRRLPPSSVIARKGISARLYLKKAREPVESPRAFDIARSESRLVARRHDSFLAAARPRLRTRRVRGATPMRTLLIMVTIFAGTDAIADEWKLLPSLPDKEGFAGSFAGVSNGAMIVAGGANFPDKKPWDGGKKLWYDTVFVLERFTNALHTDNGHETNRECRVA